MGEKQACRVNKLFNGLVDLIEHPYQEADADGGGMTFWFGVVDVTATFDEFNRLQQGSTFRLDLEDGRAGLAVRLGIRVDDVPSAAGGRGPGQLFLIYFFGLTALDKPPGPPAAALPALRPTG